MIGATYIVKEAFKPLCCNAVFRAGEMLMVSSQPSKNRLMILRKGIEGHKVKRSTFLRCCELKDVV